MATRSDWLTYLQNITRPVFRCAAEGTLTQHLPQREGRPAPYAPCEALCRTFAGISPFLEATQSDAAEASLQLELLEAVTLGLTHASTPDHPDRFRFAQPGQPLVEAAFLCQGLLRAPAVWEALDPAVQRRLVTQLVESRVTRPPFCNWLLFAAMVEVFLGHIGEPFDRMRIDYAVQQHEQWYLGDGMYSDGRHYHHDYYNSYVIQPMLMDVLATASTLETSWDDLIPSVQSRFDRYTVIQERTIGTEGSFPVVGRSICYRCGAFHHLAQAALQHRLPPAIPPAQAREALSAVIARCLDAPGTFDDDGWLTIGLAGKQPYLAEPYISRGSVYLCCLAFLPLGLDANDPFWADDALPWTSRRVWSGEDMPADHAAD